MPHSSKKIISDNILKHKTLNALLLVSIDNQFNYHIPELTCLIPRKLKYIWRLKDHQTKYKGKCYSYVLLVHETAD